MRLREGKYECAQCGALLDIPPQDSPTVVIHGGGGHPNVRVLTYEGREIHRCEISTFEPLRREKA